MNNKKVNKLVALPFIIAGIIFACAGYFIFNRTDLFMKTAIETKAKVITVSNEKTDTKIVVEFSANDSTFKGELKEYSSSIKVGDTISIFYDKANPENFKSNISYYISYIFMGIGALIIICGLFVMVKTNLKYRKYLNVKSSGVRLDARIVGIDMDNTVAKSGVNPYYVTCMGMNPITRQEETYRSENLWYDVRKIIDDNNLAMIPVYIDEQNPSNYYVDVTVLNIYNK